MAHTKRRWLRLDNAAKLYPAARRRNWASMFRLSATLTEKIDPTILQTALDAVFLRFPSMAVHLRRGLFWYYLHQMEKAPAVLPDNPCPCMKMSRSELKNSPMRVLYYENRIAVEFFHSITDGSGGLIFLKTLTAEYLSRKYGTVIPPDGGILDINEAPHEAELEDSFLKYRGEVPLNRKEPNAYCLPGTPEKDNYRNLITGTLPLSEVLAAAKSHGVSLTVYLTAILIEAIAEIQRREVPDRMRRKMIKIMVPVNLRRFFESRTLRNFILYVAPGIDPRMGDYSFEEILKIVHHKMGSELDAKQLAARIAANVRTETHPFIRVTPLFIKNICMKVIYVLTGQRLNCAAFSNLGAAMVPPEMQPYVTRFDFILGVPAVMPSNCGAISYGDSLCLSFTRSTKEPILEREFFTALKKRGITAKLESNTR